MKFAQIILLSAMAVSCQNLLAQENSSRSPLTPIEVGTAAGVSEETLGSPYFIDEVHCEGFVIDERSLRWVEEENKAAQIKAINKQYCENLFHSFKVEKYTWQSADDLEIVQIAIKASQLFESSDLSLKKSEIKNHVHLFLKVQPKKPTQEFSLDLYSNSTGGFSKFDYIYHSKDHAPNSVSNLGISQFSIMDGKIDASEITLTDGVAKLDLKENTVVNPFWEVNTLGSLDSRIRLNLFSRNYRANSDTSTFEFEMEGDLLKKNRTGIFGTQYFGLAYHYFNAVSMAEILDDNLRRKSSTVSILAPGLRTGFNLGDAKGRFFDIDLVGYRVSTDSYALKTQMDLGFKLESTFFGEQLKFGFLTEQFKNYLSAVGRSEIGDRNLSTLSLQMSKRMGSTKYADLLTYGLEERSLSARAADFKVKTTGQSYAKLGYQTSWDNWDLRFGLNVEL